MFKHLRATDEWADKNALQKGFTLVELLVVITILGILAAVVVFAVNGISDNGQVSACKADKQTLTTAIEAYRAKNGVSTTPTEAQLKSGGLLADVSTYYDISWAGTTYTVSPQSGSPCT